MILFPRNMEACFRKGVLRLDGQVRSCWRVNMGKLEGSNAEGLVFFGTSSSPNNPRCSMGLPYMPISWGGARGVNVYRHIWQSHGVYGYWCWFKVFYRGPTKADQVEKSIQERYRGSLIQLHVESYEHTWTFKGCPTEVP